MLWILKYPTLHQAKLFTQSSERTESWHFMEPTEQAVQLWSAGRRVEVWLRSPCFSCSPHTASQWGSFICSKLHITFTKIFKCLPNACLFQGWSSACGIVRCSRRFQDDRTGSDRWRRWRNKSLWVCPWRTIKAPSSRSSVPWPRGFTVCYHCGVLPHHKPRVTGPID